MLCPGLVPLWWEGLAKAGIEYETRRSPWSDLQRSREGGWGRRAWREASKTEWLSPDSGGGRSVLCSKVNTD